MCLAHRFESKQERRPITSLMMDEGCLGYVYGVRCNRMNFVRKVQLIEITYLSSSFSFLFFFSSINQKPLVSTSFFAEASQHALFIDGTLQNVFSTTLLIHMSMKSKPRSTSSFLYHQPSSLPCVWIYRLRRKEKNGHEMFCLLRERLQARRVPAPGRWYDCVFNASKSFLDTTLNDPF